jgi:hypothetical protein
MITAVVRFQMGAGMDAQKAAEIFRATAPRYLGLPGLARKYYLFDPESGKGGGCYLFKDRASAAAVFDASWKALIREKYGAEPEIAYFETPVIVDNLTHEIQGAEG